MQSCRVPVVSARQCAYIRISGVVMWLGWARSNAPGPGRHTLELLALAVSSLLQEKDLNQRAQYGMHARTRIKHGELSTPMSNARCLPRIRNQTYLKAIEGVGALGETSTHSTSVPLPANGVRAEGQVMEGGREDDEGEDTGESDMHWPRHPCAARHLPVLVHGVSPSIVSRLQERKINENKKPCHLETTTST
jgi:hypothetical protein